MHSLGEAIIALLFFIGVPNTSVEAAAFWAVTTDMEQRQDSWDQLSICESTGRWDINTRNGYYGGIQFHPVSWRYVGGTGLPHQWSRLEQIYRGERLLTIQGPRAWPGCDNKARYLRGLDRLDF